MTIPKFLQIHTLHSYPAALLNRDDSGLAKRMPFGGAVRTRISSQCLKRHWRVAQDDFALHSIAGSASALRSRNIVERKVIEPLKEAGGIDEGVLKAVNEAFNVGVYGGSGTSESGRQPLLLGLPEVEYLQEKAAAICAEYPNDVEAAKGAATDLFHTRRGEGNNFRAFRESAALPGGLEGALFGRMVTSDPGANIDAAVHVAHAFTVHAEEAESDYFVAVDDLTSDDETGADTIQETELTSGLFYGYVVVDIPLLLGNLGGDAAMAGQVLHNLIYLIAEVSPGAKLGSTAPYGRASLMLLEVGDRQPRSLAEAYRKACAPDTGIAFTRLSNQLKTLDNVYATGEERRFLALSNSDIPAAERATLAELATWAKGLPKRLS